MENLSIETKPVELETPKEEYNNIPVVYCKHCLSLAIRNSDGIDYCDKCGGTETGEHTYMNGRKCMHRSMEEIM